MVVNARGSCLLIISAMLALASCLANPAPASGQGSLPESFAYVLQADKLSPTKAKAIERLAGCKRDWMVLDAGFATDEGSRWTRAELARIRNGRPGRKIIAYLSIGEAEDYRSYWKPAWRRVRPSFVLNENRDWPGNYRVKFWEPQWRAIVFEEVDSLLQQGFDGLYLDKVDIYEDFEYDAAKGEWLDDRKNPETGRSYRSDMVDFVRQVASRARRKKKDALIVPQNASALVERAAYRNIISGIGIEDLFTDGEKVQPAEETRFRERPLKQLVSAGKPVLCVDYSTAATLRSTAMRAAMARGYCLLMTDRDLATMGRSLEEMGYLGAGYHNRSKRFTRPELMEERDWSDPDEIERTWNAALVRIPGGKGGAVFRSTMRVLELPKPIRGKAFPTVIYLHGCSGVWPGTYRRIDLLARNGFAVIAPVSMARRKYPKSCDPVRHRGGLYRPTLKMRQYDARHAILRAKKLPWVDADNVFLVGLSQGAITAATLTTDDPSAHVNARVLEGWTCHAGWEEYRGVNAPKDEPVLALVAGDDPWFGKPWNRGDCGTFLDPTNGSRSIVFRQGKLSKRHELLEDPRVQRIVIAFLKQHLRREGRGEHP